MAKRRRLNQAQQATAADAMRFVQPSIAAFLRRNPNLRQAAKRCDLESVAYQAVCMAALTYKREKSQPTTYFGSAIRHALLRAVIGQGKQDCRFRPTDQHDRAEPDCNPHRHRLESRAMKAIKMLHVFERTLLEDRLIEQVTLEQLGLEQECDPRTVQKKIQRAIAKLRQAEADLP